MENEIIYCTQCKSKLRVPCNKGVLEITCPRCKNKFRFDSGLEVVDGGKEGVCMKKLLMILGVIAIIGVVISEMNNNGESNEPIVIRTEDNGQVVYFTSSYEKGQELEEAGYTVIYRPEEELSQMEDQFLEIMNKPYPGTDQTEHTDSQSGMPSNNNQVVDTNLPTEDKTFHDKDYFDYLLSEGDGLKLVVKLEESLTEVVAAVGVLNQNAEWAMPLSTDNPLSEQLNDSSNIKERCEFLAGQAKYAGDGVFVIGEDEQLSNVNHNYVAKNAILLNLNTQSWINIGAYKSHQSICFVDGYYVAVDPETYRVKVITTVSEPYLLDIEFSIWYNHQEDYLGKYAEGLFFARPESDKAGFFNVEGEKVIDLDEYAELLTFTINVSNNWEHVQPYFENGIATLTARKSQGTPYVATIDSDGNFITEFTEET